MPTHFAANDKNCILLYCWLISIEQTCCIYFINSSADGHWGWIYIELLWTVLRRTREYSRFGEVISFPLDTLRSRFPHGNSSNLIPKDAINHKTSHINRGTRTASITINTTPLSDIFWRFSSEELKRGQAYFFGKLSLTSGEWRWVHQILKRGTRVCVKSWMVTLLPWMWCWRQTDNVCPAALAYAHQKGA